LITIVICDLRLISNLSDTGTHHNITWFLTAFFLICYGGMSFRFLGIKSEFTMQISAFYSIYSSKLFKAFLIILLLLPVISYGDLYYWIDENGVKHYSNYQPENNAIEIKKTEEYVQDENEDPTSEENSESPRSGDNRRKTSTKQIKTGYGPKVNIKFIFYDFDAVNRNDLRDEMKKKHRFGTTVKNSAEAHIPK